MQLMLRINIPVYTIDVWRVLKGWSDLWDHQVVVNLGYGLPHAGVVVTLEDGSTWLVHKGNI